MDWLQHLERVWHYAAAALTLSLAISASGHALLYRRDTRETPPGPNL
jgi:hypothetical protein